jgi:hypothetical protein
MPDTHGYVKRAAQNDSLTDRNRRTAWSLEIRMMKGVMSSSVYSVEIFLCSILDDD